MGATATAERDCGQGRYPKLSVFLPPIASWCLPLAEPNGKPEGKGAPPPPPQVVPSAQVRLPGTEQDRDGCRVS